MLAPYWYLNGSGTTEGMQWGPPSVSVPFQPRPFMALPMNSSSSSISNFPVIRPRVRQMRPHLPTTVYPRQVLLESIKRDTIEDQSDLGNLDGVLNFNLANILPPNFGFGENEDRKIKIEELGDHSNEALQTASNTRDISLQNIYQADFNRGNDAYKVEPDDNQCYEDGNVSPKLIIDTASTDQKRPPYSYSELIDLALRSEGEMTVRELYQWIMDHFEYYRNTEPSKWQPSVRHTLTINPAFGKIKKVRGGNLWGHASVRDKAMARKQKNHWKKQKIAEYVKTSSRRRRKEGSSSGSSTNTTPDLTIPKLTSTLRNNLELEREVEMEDVEMDMNSQSGLLSKSGIGSRTSSNRSTPAKRAKKTSAEAEEPTPEICKTQTRHGRLTNKLNYKIFSKKGMQSHSGVSKNKHIRCKYETQRRYRKADLDREPEYSSDDMDADIDSDQDIFTSELPDRKDITMKATGYYSQHTTPIDMITPEVSPSCNSQAKIFQAIANAALKDLDNVCVKSFAQGSDQMGTPAHLVVSDLQDFEPTESTESILASTSALTKFASMSEAALILSSLEASPRTRGCGEHELATYSIEITVEEKEYPEDPIPQPSEETAQGKELPNPNSQSEDVSPTEERKGAPAEPDIADDTTRDSEDVENHGKRAEGFRAPDSDPARETKGPQSMEIIVTIMSPALDLVNQENIDALPGSPVSQPQTSSPVTHRSALLSPNSSPITSVISPDCSPIQSSAGVPPSLVQSLARVQTPVSSTSGQRSSPRCGVNLPMPVTEPLVNARPLPLLQPSPNIRSSPSGMQSANSLPSSPMTLPPQRPTLATSSPTTYRCIGPISLPASQVCSPRTLVRHPNTSSFPAVGWAMPGLRAVFMDRDDQAPAHQLLREDVPLSDAWRNNPVHKKCSKYPEKPQQAVLPPRRHQPPGHIKEMVSPIGLPMYVPNGGRMPSPVYQYVRNIRPLSASRAHNPYLQPFALAAPSPVRPEQTAQAFTPLDKATPRQLGSPLVTPSNEACSIASSAKSAVSVPQIVSSSCTLIPVPSVKAENKQSSLNC